MNEMDSSKASAILAELKPTVKPARTSRHNPLTDALKIQKLLWHVTKSPTGCWEFDIRNQHGYGLIRFSRPAKVLAHRASYTLFCGPIPEGMCVCHRCDNPPCINPAHLFLGTHQENIRDMDLKNRRKSTCGDNHPSAKLNREKVIEIRKLWDAKVRVGQIMRMFNISDQLVRYVGKRETWRHVSESNFG